MIGFIIVWISNVFITNSVIIVYNFISPPLSFPYTLYTLSLTLHFSPPRSLSSPPFSTFLAHIFGSSLPLSIYFSLTHMLAHTPYPPLFVCHLLTHTCTRTPQLHFFPSLAHMQSLLLSCFPSLFLYLPLISSSFLLSFILPTTFKCAPF